jgi:glycosyltransferase involved in cell wall biosynthesis
VLNWAEDIAYRTLGRAVLRASSHIVLATPSAALCADALLGHERPPRSMFPVGIDMERFRPPADGRRHRARAELGVPDSCQVVLFAGRFVEKKGLPIVLDVSRQLPGVHFLLAGDGPLRDMLPTGSSNITWHRMVEPESMPLFYHAADCVLLPSHGEGLPLTVQEATASGLPCVISQDEPYAGALVEAEVCAAAPRETSAMAAAVTQVLESEARPLGGRARAYAKEHWSVDTMVTRHIALFEQLLAAAVPPSA